MNDSSDLDIQEHLEVKEGWKAYYLSAFIIWIGVIAICFISEKSRQDTINFFFYNLTWAKLPAFLAILSIPAICLFYYFDKRVKLMISKDGIWTKKHGTLSWETLWYFYSKQTYLNEGDIYTIYLKQKEEVAPFEKEKKIEFRRIDKDFDEIRAKINGYASKYGIEDRGHKKGWF